MVEAFAARAELPHACRRALESDTVLDISHESLIRLWAR